MSVATSNEFLESLRKSGLFDEQELDITLASYTGTTEEPAKIAEFLIKQKKLTSFQAKSLLAGRHKGLIIGAYKVMDKIGAGGMGIVYLAEHEKLKRRVAIKILPEDKTRDKLSLERFYREARAAAALDHPNIVKAYDISSMGQTHYLVMEYIDGTNLQKYVDNKGPLPWKTAINIVVQSCKGLQHAHERNVVHRDIKPANILVDKSGQVKILDLGLARSFQINQDNLTQDLSDGKDVMGSIDYIAPEQAIANNAIDTRADIYSLGATLYTLITGKPPVEGTTAQKLLQHQMQMPTPINRIKPEVPEAVAHVVARMMAKRPEHRYQSPNEVIAALTPFLGTNSQPMPGIVSTQFNTAPLSQNITGNLHRQTDLLQPTSPIKGPSGNVASHSTKIESKGATRRVKKFKKKSTLDNRLSTRTIFIIVGIAAVLIPTITLFIINSGGKGHIKKADPGAIHSLIGDKFQIKTGSKMPDLKYDDFSNVSFRLSNYQGKVILIEFWGFWDPNSIKLFSLNKSMPERMKSRPFVLLGVNTDKTQEDIDLGLKKHFVNWRNVKNKQADGSILSQSFGVKSSPTLILIDADGVVRRIWEEYYDHVGIELGVEEWVKDAEIKATQPRRPSSTTGNQPPGDNNPQGNGPPRK